MTSKKYLMFHIIAVVILLQIKYSTNRSCSWFYYSYLILTKRKLTYPFCLIAPTIYFSSLLFISVFLLFLLSFESFIGYRRLLSKNIRFKISSYQINNFVNKSSLKHLYTNVKKIKYKKCAENDCMGRGIKDVSKGGNQRFSQREGWYFPCCNRLHQRKTI